MNILYLKSHFKSHQCSRIGPKQKFTKTRQLGTLSMVWHRFGFVTPQDQYDSIENWPSKCDKNLEEKRAQEH